MPALLRARKLLIVGDDQQVSPEGVGLEEQKIKTLMQRFLAEQVPLYRAQISPERSIYDQITRGALPFVRFPGSRRIWLDRGDLDALIDKSKEVRA